VKRRFLKTYALALFLGSSWISWALAQDTAAPADLPSAESILDRYVEVTGGEDAYRNLTSTVARGTMAISAAGITGQLEIYVEPGLYYMHVELPNVGVIESGVTADGVAWENNVITGPRILTGAEAEMALVGAQPAAPLRWRDLYAQAETTGVEEVNGEAAHRVALTTESGFSMTGSYSIESGLLLKQQMTVSAAGVGEIPIQQFFENYQEFGGILSAGRIVIDQGVAPVVLTFTSGEVNVDIPDERFAMPDAVLALQQ
jgi:hypothetical protein